MKNFKKSKILVLCLLGMVSCEKTEPDTEMLNVKEQEDFMSTTGNSDVTLADSQSRGIKPIFHMHFGPEISKEEASSKFDKAIAEYLKKQKRAKPVLRCEIVLYTGLLPGEQGNATHMGTDGRVQISLDFLTNLGRIYYNDVVLDNPGNDREGGLDYYYIEVPPRLNGNKVLWMEIESAGIKLKGTDGWYLNYLFIICNKNESDPFHAEARLVSKPKMWLDNETSNGWDLFHTNDSETTNSGGRVWFPLTGDSF